MRTLQEFLNENMLNEGGESGNIVFNPWNTKKDNGSFSMQYKEAYNPKYTGTMYIRTTKGFGPKDKDGQYIHIDIIGDMGDSQTLLLTPKEAKHLSDSINQGIQKLSKGEYTSTLSQ